MLDRSFLLPLNRSEVPQSYSYSSSYSSSVLLSERKYQRSRTPQPPCQSPLGLRKIRAPNLERPSKIHRRLRSPRSLDLFAPTRESEDELEYEYDWGTSERLRGRRNERSSTSFPRNLFLVPRFRSSIVIVLELVLVLVLAGQGGIYNKLDDMSRQQTALAVNCRLL